MTFIGFALSWFGNSCPSVAMRLDETDDVVPLGTKKTGFLSRSNVPKLYRVAAGLRHCPRSIGLISYRIEQLIAAFALIPAHMNELAN